MMIELISEKLDKIKSPNDVMLTRYQSMGKLIVIYNQEEFFHIVYAEKVYLFLVPVNLS